MNFLDLFRIIGGRKSDVKKRKYKAFISYKHSEWSHKHAEALETAIKKYDKNWLKPPIKIFRDKNELKIGESIPTGVKDGLRNAEYFILLASKEAANSWWVQQELIVWCQELKRVGNLIIVLINDEIELDKDRIIWEKTDALPILLKEYIKTIPLYLDLKWAKSNEMRSLSNSKYKDAVIGITAGIYQMTPGAMREKKSAELRKEGRLKNIIIILLMVLALIAGGSAWYAFYQREFAEKLLAKSHWENARQKRTGGQHLQAFHLFAEAIYIHPNQKSKKTILLDAHQYWQCISLRGSYRFPIIPSDMSGYSITASKLGTSGEMIFSWNEKGEGWIMNTETGKQMGIPISHKNKIVEVKFNKNGTRILTRSANTVNGDGIALLSNTQTGEELLKLKQEHGILGAVFRENENLIISWNKLGAVIEWDVSRNTKRAIITFEYEIDVEGAILNNNKSRIFIWTKDQKLLLGNLTTGKIDSLSTKQPYLIIGATFSPDDKKILAWSRDNDALLWNLNQDEPTILSHEESLIERGIFNNDATKIITCSYDGVVKLWDAKTNSKLILKVRHKGRVWGATFNSTGEKFLTWGSDGAACLWVPPAQKPSHTFLHQGDVFRAAFNRDETMILTVSGSYENHQVHRWDTSTFEQIGPELKQRGMVYVNFADKYGETILTTNSGTNTVKIWKSSIKKENRNIKHHCAIVNAIFDKNDKNRILFYDKYNFAKLWKIKNDEEQIISFPHRKKVNGAMFNSDSSKVLTWSDDMALYIWNTSTGNKELELPHHEKVIGAKLSPDEKKILTWIDGNTAHIWRIESKREPHSLTLRHDGSINGAIFNADGSRILTWSKDKTARIWDSSTGYQINKTNLNHKRNILGAQFSPNGKKILTWSSDKMVYLWNAKHFRRERTFKHEARVYGARFNPDGSKLFTWDYHPYTPYGHGQQVSKAYIRDSTADEGRETPQQDKLILGAIFTKNGESILTWSLDKECPVKLMDATTGKLIKWDNLDHKQSEVIGVMFNRDESWILTWSKDNCVRIWDINTGRKLGQTLRHKSTLNGAVFSPDEMHVLTWCENGTLKLWNIIQMDLFNEDDKLRQHIRGKTGVKYNSITQKLENF